MTFSFFAILRDRLLGADPGLARLLLASRVTLAVALTVVALALGAMRFNAPLTVGILGAIVSMQALLAINDTDARTTTLLAPLPAIAGITLGAIFAARGLMADLIFLVVLFAAVAVRARGPRWTAFGTIAMMTYFIALFLGATVSQLPSLIAAVLTSIAFSFLVRFMLLPDRPAWIARRMIEAFDARIRFVAAAARELLVTRDPHGARRRLATVTGRLNETAASIESRLGNGAAAELRIIFDAELAAEELATGAGALRDAAAHAPRGLLVALAALARGRAARAARVAGRLAQDAEHFHPTVRALAAAIVDLGETIVRVDSAAEMLALSDAPWSGGTGIQQPAMRQAIQVTVAAAVAIAIGEALSPQKWYWAVLATYFVFIGTASSGETFARAWSRIFGTALGVGAGVLVGHLAIGHPTFTVAAIFVCLFLSVYLLRTSYMMMIFFITALLALLYTLLGRFSDGLLGIRLLETAIGAICGGIAATTILPTRTHDVVRASAGEALEAARAVIHTSIACFLDPHGTAVPLDAARILEERVEHFVARAKPAIAVPVLLGRGHELRRWMVSLSACSYYGRMLARTADREAQPINGSAAQQLNRLETMISGNIHAASERVNGRFVDPTINTLPLFDELRRWADAHGAEAAGLASATHLLERLDRTIARLARDEGTIVETV